MPDHWLTYVYQYVVGGLFFFFILGAALKTGSLRWSSQEGRNTIIVLLAGFLFFLVVHGVWTYLVMGF